MIWVLLVSFQLKQFLAEGSFGRPPLFTFYSRLENYALQMIGHCSFHGVITTTIAVVVDPQLWWVGVLDFTVHFIIDSAMETLPTKSFRPNMLTLDQLLHHLTHYYIIYTLIGSPNV